MEDVESRGGKERKTERENGDGKSGEKVEGGRQRKKIRTHAVRHAFLCEYLIFSNFTCSI